MLAEIGGDGDGGYYWNDVTVGQDIHPDKGDSGPNSNTNSDSDSDSKTPRAASCAAATVDSEAAKDPLAVPLKRSLRSRHLQMIAIGGGTRPSCFLCLTADGLTGRNYWTWVTGWVRKCAEPGWSGGDFD